MNSLSTGNYQVVTQAHKGSQLANLLIRTKRSIEQTEAVKLLNPLAIEHVGFGSAWHVLYMTCIDHPNFKAMLLQNFVKTSQRYLKFSDISPFPVGGLVGRVQPL